MAFTRAELLAAVEREPAAAAVHDREAWVGLFTANGRVDDPVGSRPHRGRRQIARFYDTFIGPRDITFHRDVDVVVGVTVIRDLELALTMTAGLTMRIPAYLRYDLQPVGDALKIARLQAFWELPTMVGQFLRNGARAVPAGTQLTLSLVRNQGLAGAAGFLGGFRGVGSAGKRQFERFLDDARAGDEVAVRRRLAKGAAVTTGDDGALSTSTLLNRLAAAHWRKPIAAGRSLVVGVEREGRRDVLIADVNPKPFTVNRIRYFTEAGFRDT
jgi:hypothetical protein